VPEEGIGSVQANVSKYRTDGVPPARARLHLANRWPLTVHPWTVNGQESADGYRCAGHGCHGCLDMRLVRAIRNMLLGGDTDL
jgi:hypothetical protein